MKNRIKKILCIMLTVFICLGSISCGSSSSNASGASGGNVKNLIVGTSSPPETNSIVSQNGSLGKFNYNSITYACFFYPDEQNNMLPYFLNSYEISKDGYEVSMTFPTTAIWHDGKPVTVDDVVFSFEYRRDVLGSSSLQKLKEVRVDADDAVTVIFSEPVAYFFVKNSGLTMFVIPKHIWENVTDPSAYTGEDAVIGCGPYRLVSTDIDAGIINFEAVPENSYLGELTVETITLKSYSSPDTLLMGLSNGEVDVIYEYASPISYTLLDVISGNKDVDFGESVYTGCNQVTFGMSEGPNLNHDFREAAVKSLNWKLLCSVSNGDYGQIPGSGIIPTACLGYDESLWTMYQDTNEAKNLLDKAGFVDKDGDGLREMPDGTKFKYKVTSQYAVKKQDLLNRIGEVIVSSLRDVGIDAYYDQESIKSDEANKSMVANNEYDMFIGYTSTGVAAYRTAYWYFMNRDIVGPGGMQWGGSYTDEDLNNAYKSLNNAINNEEYIKAVKELQKLGSEDLFAFAICWEKCFFPYRTDKYTGFENYPSVGVVHAETFYKLKNK